jgi:hypothetical protein
MAQRRHHYERAFEGFLRARRIPYVAVDEARKALVPSGGSVGGLDGGAGPALKSFDFVLYGNGDLGSALGGLGYSGSDGANLLVDIKGRKVGRRKERVAPRDDALRVGRLESWVTLEDIRSLTEWEKLFGEGFKAAFVFVYACEAQPPDALFQEVFEHGGTWYALRVVTLGEYVKAMKVRSPRWGTVDIARRVFERSSQPLTGGIGCVAAGGPPEGLFDLGPVVPALG